MEGPIEGCHHGMGGLSLRSCAVCNILQKMLCGPCESKIDWKKNIKSGMPLTLSVRHPPAPPLGCPPAFTCNSVLGPSEPTCIFSSSIATLYTCSTPSASSRALLGPWGAAASSLPALPGRPKRRPPGLSLPPLLSVPGVVGLDGACCCKAAAVGGGRALGGAGGGEVDATKPVCA
eukprot:1157646-Pelagomonas_calceolata.AAC.2